MKTKLVHVWLDPDRIITLGVEAKRRGISIHEIVRGLWVGDSFCV
jgi:hypothetical protein